MVVLQGSSKTQGVYAKGTLYPPTSLCVRDGSPLSLSLSLSLYNIKRGGYLLGYNIKNANGEVTNISHLLVADDTLVFRKDYEDECSI